LFSCRVCSLIIFSDTADESLNTVVLTNPLEGHEENYPNKYRSWMISQAIQWLTETNTAPKSVEFFLFMQDLSFPLLDQINWRMYKFRSLYRSAEADDIAAESDPTLPLPPEALGPYPPFIAGRPTYRVIDSAQLKPMWTDQNSAAHAAFHGRRLKTVATYMIGLSRAFLTFLQPFTSPAVCPVMVPDDLALAGLFECANVPNHQRHYDWLSMTRDHPGTKELDATSTLSEWRAMDIYSHMESTQYVKDAYAAYYQRLVE
jgi:hypothetical protein